MSHNQFKTKRQYHLNIFTGSNINIYESVCIYVLQASMPAIVKMTLLSQL